MTVLLAVNEGHSTRSASSEKDEGGRMKDESEEEPLHGRAFFHPSSFLLPPSSFD
jgi:hypothetical protein